MKSARLLIGATAALALIASGCSMISAIARGDVKGAAEAGARISREMVEAGKEAGTDCEPLKTATVTYTEELAIGGAIAIGLTQSNKAHFFLDGMTEKTPAALKAKVDKGEKIVLPASDKNAVDAYVAVVGKNLALASDRPDIKWTFGVLDSPTVNAFSAPGGYVVITTGLLKVIDNEAQLAGALSHEVGHVTNRHAVKTYMGAKHALCILAMTAKHGKDRLGNDLPAGASEALAFADPILKSLASGGAFDLDSDTFSGGFVAKLTDLFMEAWSKGMSKEQEFEADKTALELLVGAGYDSKEFDALLAKLPSGGAFSTHPAAKDRTDALEALRKSDYDGFANGKVKGDAAPLKVVKK